MIYNSLLQEYFQEMSRIKQYKQQIQSQRVTNNRKI